MLARASSFRALAQACQRTRPFSFSAAAASEAQPAPSAQPALTPAPPAAAAARAYAVPRSANGNVPVYTDLKSSGMKTVLWIRNIQGDVAALASDLQASLFPAQSPEAQRMVARVVRSRHVVLEGGDARWKHRVTDWINARGL